MDDPDAFVALLGAASALADRVVTPLVEYRTRLEAAGFSREAAEQMVVQLHAGLIAKAFSQ